MVRKGCGAPLAMRWWHNTFSNYFLTGYNCIAFTQKPFYISALRALSETACEELIAVVCRHTPAHTQLWWYEKWFCVTLSELCDFCLNLARARFFSSFLFSLSLVGAAFAVDATVPVPGKKDITNIFYVTVSSSLCALHCAFFTNPRIKPYMATRRNMLSHRMIQKPV